MPTCTVLPVRGGSTGARHRGLKTRQGLQERCQAKMHALGNVEDCLYSYFNKTIRIGPSKHCFLILKSVGSRMNEKKHALYDPKVLVNKATSTITPTPSSKLRQFTKEKVNRFQKSSSEPTRIGSMNPRKQSTTRKIQGESNKLVNARLGHACGGRQQPLLPLAFSLVMRSMWMTNLRR